MDSLLQKQTIILIIEQPLKKRSFSLVGKFF